ncbi:hypothetical protein EDB92DRAFT_2104383 [Lactarius akahatsu]|uniref:DUF6534 domain-containing protein n=1 Tax=Lactarius akahatsu TaxID=416441 RepID=A0AAD4LEY5_9AGAM|nr:hypothetical protein EDB92DRAFT_2104383 [Lactarius akahatsu]
MTMYHTFVSTGYTLSTVLHAWSVCLGDEISGPSRSCLSSCSMGDSGFAKTDSVIMASMAYGVNSSLLTGLLSLASTISIVVPPSSMIWLAFYWSMSKCYINSVLAMLNSRDYIRGRQSTTDRQDNAYSISSIRVAPSNEARVSFSVQHTTTLGYGRNKSDHDEEPTFEVPKPV